MRVFKRTKTSTNFDYSFTVGGKRYRGSTGMRNRKDAEKVMMREYNELLRVTRLGDKPEIALKDAMQRTVQSVSGSTETSYDLSRRKLLGRDRFKGSWKLDGEMMLHKLRYDDLEDLILARKKEGLRDNSIGVELRLLKRMQNLCSKRFRVNHDLEFPKVRTFVRTRFVSYDEEAEILAMLDEKADEFVSYRKARELYLFQVDTGNRLSETLALQWRDFDWNERLLKVYRSKSRTVSHVPLSSRVTEALSGRRNAPLPFQSMDYAIKVLRRVLNKVCNQDERLVRDQGELTIHSLRDTFVTRAEANGISLRKIGLVIGHSNIETTKKYGHLQSSDIVDEMRRAIG